MNADLHDDSDETLIDAYHAGYDCRLRAENCPHFDDPAVEKAWLDGNRDARMAARVQVLMPARAEGYYHVNPNGEDY